MSPDARVARRGPVALLLCAAFLWSLGGVLIKWVDWSPLAIAGTRSAIAAVTIYLIARPPHLRFSSWTLAGAAAYAATVMLFVAATKLTTAANAIFLQYTAPIYVALFSRWFLNEKVSRLDWALIVVALGGIGLFFLDELSTEGRWGNILALASGLSFAALAILLRKQRDESPLNAVLLGNVLAAVICLPFMFRQPPGWGGWAALGFLGVVQLGLSYICYTRAIRSVTAMEAILILTIEPILNPLWVMLMLGEKPEPWAFAGGALVLAAVTVRAVLTAKGTSAA